MTDIDIERKSLSQLMSQENTLRSFCPGVYSLLSLTKKIRNPFEI